MDHYDRTDRALISLLYAYLFPFYTLSNRFFNLLSDCKEKAIISFSYGALSRYFSLTLYPAIVQQQKHFFL